MSDALDGREEILHGQESNAALAKFAAADYLGSQFIVLSEKQMLADPNLPARPDQTLPFVGIF
jgi:hypothetical protein